MDPGGWTTGKLFRLFMLGYCAWRFAVEFIKPTWKPLLGISALSATYGALNPWTHPWLFDYWTYLQWIEY